MIIMRGIIFVKASVCNGVVIKMLKKVDRIVCKFMVLKSLAAGGCEKTFCDCDMRVLKMNVTVEYVNAGN